MIGEVLLDRGMRSDSVPRGAMLPGSFRKLQGGSVVDGFMVTVRGLERRSGMGSEGWRGRR